MRLIIANVNSSHLGLQEVNLAESTALRSKRKKLFYLIFILKLN